MTEYEKIRNELVRLGWAETQGRGDHRKFTKDGMRPISVSMSISDNARAFKNACSNIRKVEPGFSLSKASVGKDKEMRQQVQQRVQERLSGLTDEQKRFRQAKFFIRPGEKVRYVTPEERDWDFLAYPDAVMNIPYEVVEIKGAGYVSSPDDPVTISHADTTIEVRADELESFALSKCSLCGREVPESIITPLSDIRDQFGMEQSRSLSAIEHLLCGRIEDASLCVECVGELSRGAADAMSDIKKERIDMTAATFEQSAPAELSSVISVGDDGRPEIAGGTPTRLAFRALLVYRAWSDTTEKIKETMSRSVKKDKGPESVAEMAAKLTPYQMWQNMRLAWKNKFQDTKGIDRITYEQTRVGGVNIFQVNVQNYEQAEIVTCSMEVLMEIVRQFCPDGHLVVANRQASGRFLVPNGSTREEQAEEIRLLREKLPEKVADEILFFAESRLALPSTQEITKTVAGVLDEFGERYGYDTEGLMEVHMANFENGGDRTPRFNVILISHEEGRFLWDLHDVDWLGDSLRESLGIKPPMELYVGYICVSEDDKYLPSDIIKNSEPLYGSNTFAEVFGTPHVHVPCGIEDVVARCGDGDAVLVEALTLYDKVNSGIEALCGREGCTREELWDKGYVITYGKEIKIININDMKEQEKTPEDASGLSAYDTKDLLKELRRRGTRNLEKLEVPVITYQSVNVNEL